MVDRALLLNAVQGQGPLGGGHMCCQGTSCLRYGPL